MNDIQKCILDIYKSVRELCDRHSIPYYAIGGTCLGAIRHNGFIPWDDDMDIAIPIEYFEKFQDFAKKELPDHLKIYSGYNTNSYSAIFIKVINTRTTFIERENMFDPKSYKGVFLDIMPIAGVPEDKNERDKYFRFIFHNIKMNAIRRTSVRSHTTLLKRSIALITIPIRKLIPRNYFLDKCMSKLRNYPFMDSVMTGYTWGAYGGRALCFPQKWFSQPADIRFEDTVIYCPKEYDKYLSYQFGDYMKLPPKEKRFSGHVGLVDTQTSFLKYAKTPATVRKRIKSG